MADTAGFILTIDMTVTQHDAAGYRPGSLQVRESMELGDMDFLQMMKVLAQMHDAIKKIKGEVE